jgi:hypothetical protein
MTTYLIDNPPQVRQFRARGTATTAPPAGMRRGRRHGSRRWTASAGSTTRRPGGSAPSVTTTHVTSS